MKRIFAISIKRISGRLILAAFVIITMTFNMQMIKAGNNDPKTNEMLKPNPTSELTLHLEPYVYPNGYNISCYDRKDGSITLTVTGGVQPYSYEWSNREYTKDIDSLSASYYEVRVKDAQGRIASAGITLIPPPKEVSDPIINFDIHEYSPNMNVTCYNCCNGMIEISVTGGSGMYSYQWGDGPTTPDRYGLCQGNYQVVIKDVSGCGDFKEHVRNFTINGPERDDWSMNGNSNSDPSIQFMGTKDNKDFVIKTNDTLRMKIKANGNVGIGTSNPTEKLTVGGNAKIYDNFTVGKKMEIFGSLKIDSLAGVGLKMSNLSSSSYKLVFINEKGEFVTKMKNDGYYSTCHPEAPIMPWSLGGNVIIDPVDYMPLYDYTFIGTCNEYPFKMYTFGQERMRITPEGNVGIGTITPQSKLVVIGNGTTLSTSTVDIKDNNDNSLFYIRDDGKVGIGINTANEMPDDISGNRHYRLYVRGGILTEMCRVAVKGSMDWSDFVFKKEFELMTISDLEKFITKNNHLPNVPTSVEVVKTGIDVAQMDALLLQKIEELTLYIIQLQKQIDVLKLKQ